MISLSLSKWFTNNATICEKELEWLKGRLIKFVRRQTNAVVVTVKKYMIRKKKYKMEYDYSKYINFC